MNIVKIDPKEYGLTSVKAKEISKMFKPMLDKMEELENEYNVIVGQEQSEELSAVAKELRLKYVKVRTGTSEIHKSLKAFYLNGGRFVDAFKNTQIFAAQEIENELMQIEKHYEFLEAEAKAKLQEERVAEIHKFIDYENDHATMQDPATMDLGGMDNGIYANFLAGMKLGYEQRRAAEKLAKEQEALRAKEAEEAALKQAKEDERIRRENAKLKKEAEVKRIQQEEADKIKAAERKKLQDKLDAEIAARVEAEQKEAKEAEEKLSQGDKANWIDMECDLLDLKEKYKFKSKKNIILKADVDLLLDKLIDYVCHKK